jgi:hypothetical protein
MSLKQHTEEELRAMTPEALEQLRVRLVKEANELRVVGVSELAPTDLGGMYYLVMVRKGWSGVIRRPLFYNPKRDKEGNIVLVDGKPILSAKNVEREKLLEFMYAGVNLADINVSAGVFDCEPRSFVGRDGNTITLHTVSTIVFNEETINSAIRAAGAVPKGESAITTEDTVPKDSPTPRMDYKADDIEKLLRKTEVAGNFDQEA